MTGPDGKDRDLEGAYVRAFWEEVAKDPAMPKFFDVAVYVGPPPPSAEILALCDVLERLGSMMVGKVGEKEEDKTFAKGAEYGISIAVAAIREVVNSTKRR